MLAWGSAVADFWRCNDAGQLPIRWDGYCPMAEIYRAGTFCHNQRTRSAGRRNR